MSERVRIAQLQQEAGEKEEAAGFLGEQGAEGLQGVVLSDECAQIALPFDDTEAQRIPRFGRLEARMPMEGEGILPRAITVWLPPLYDKEITRRFPVLYMHDGQNLFDPASSYAGVTWRVDEAIQALTEEGKIDPPLVVGLHNTPDRLEDYAPTPKGFAYARFVVERVKPWVDAHYRTRIGREDTAVMGSSMGGLASFLLSWTYPQIFSKAGCLSPVFLNDHDPKVDVCSWVEGYHGKAKGIRLYIDNGGQGLERSLQAGCLKMVSLLRERGYRDGSDLVWFYDEPAEHHEAAWAARLWRPLSFLFGARSV